MFKVFWGFKFQIFAGNEFEERGKMMTIELSFGFPIDTWVEHPHWVLHLRHDWWTQPQAQRFLTLDHQLDGNLDRLTQSWCLRDLRLLVRGERPAMIGGARRIIGLPSSFLLIIISTQSFNYFGLCWIICWRSTKFKCFVCSKWRGIFLPALQKVLQQVQHSSLYHKSCDHNLWILPNCQLPNCDPNLWKITQS